MPGSPDLSEMDSQHAALPGDVPAIHALVRAGADANATDNDGRAAIMYTADKGHNVQALRALSGLGAAVCSPGVRLRSNVRHLHLTWLCSARQAALSGARLGERNSRHPRHGIRNCLVVACSSLYVLEVGSSREA